MTLLWIMLTPLCGAVLVGLLRNAPNLRESVSVLSGLALLWQIILLFQQMQQGQSFYLLLAEPIAGMPISLTPEPLGLLFAGLVSFLWPVTILLCHWLYARASRTEPNPFLPVLRPLHLRCTWDCIVG